MNIKKKKKKKKKRIFERTLEVHVNCSFDIRQEWKIMEG